MFQLIKLFLCLASGDCQPPPCIRHVVSGNAYTICQFDVSKSKLGLYLKDKNNNVFGSVRSLRNSLENEGLNLKFAMNGGMYHADYTPVGLYIENGVEKQKISTKSGYGNFHLLPNGVFFFGNGKAGVLETGQYISAKLKPQFATQSGPMLVMGGKMHPKFMKNSPSFKIRNGVGISADGSTVYFAISIQPVRFWDFGALFRDYLKTPNALFLDGSISTLYSSTASQGGLIPIGPIIAVTR